MAPRALRRVASPAYWAAQRRHEQFELAARRARRMALLARLKWAADAAQATVDVDIASDVTIGRRVRVEVKPGSRNVLHVGAGSRLGDDVSLLLKGGELLVGERVDIRHRCVLNVAGRLELAGDNVVSWGCVLHCSEAITVEPQVIIGEYSTVVDSSHYFSAPGEHVWHNVRTGRVAIGANTWVCAKATIGRGVSIGDHCIVGGNAVVTGDVPSGHLASGVPATVRPLDLPWSTAVERARTRADRPA